MANLARCLLCNPFQWRIQDFPYGGGRGPRTGGRGPPKRLRFKNFACQNERIPTRWLPTPALIGYSDTQRFSHKGSCSWYTIIVATSGINSLEWVDCLKVQKVSSQKSSNKDNIANDYNEHWPDTLKRPFYGISNVCINTPIWPNGVLADFYQRTFVWTVLAFIYIFAYHVRAIKSYNETYILNLMYSQSKVLQIYVNSCLYLYSVTQLWGTLLSTEQHGKLKTPKFCNLRLRSSNATRQQFWWILSGTNSMADAWCMLQP